MDTITNLISAWVADKYYVDMGTMADMPKVVRGVYIRNWIRYDDGSEIDKEREEHRIYNQAAQHLQQMAGFGNSGQKIHSSHRRQVHYLDLDKEDPDLMSFLQPAKTPT